MRVVVEALHRVGDRDELQHLPRHPPRLFLRDVLVNPDGLGDLRADFEHGVERRHRLLEDHRDVVAAHVPHLSFGQAGEIAPAEFDGAAGDLSGRGDETHDRHRRHAFPATRLPHERHGLPSPDVEGDVVDGVNDAVRGEEGGAEVLYLQYRARRAGIDVGDGFPSQTDALTDLTHAAHRSKRKAEVHSWGCAGARPSPGPIGPPSPAGRGSWLAAGDGRAPA